MYDSCVMYLLKIIEYNPTKVHLNFPFVIRFKIIHLPINIQKLNKIPFYQYVHNTLFNKKRQKYKKPWNSNFLIRVLNGDRHLQNEQKNNGMI